MNSSYEEEEEYYGKCGELFFTVKGNIAFHCTLCEDRFKSFQDYNDHILETHFAPDYKAELLEEFVNGEDEIFDRLCEEAHSIDKEECYIKIEKEEELQDSNEISNRLQDSRIETKSKTEGYRNENPNTIVMTETIPKEEIRPTIRSVNRKQTTTKRQYKCPYCEFFCGVKANIRKHINRHSLNKPHKCTQCVKAFYTRTEMIVHVRSHTGERPYLCNLCGKSFVTSGKLSEHQKRHNNKRDRPCSECNMAFINAHDLRVHMVVHSERRDYTCTLCTASFKLLDSLKKHMKLHENKRAYQCKLCDAKFNQHAGLYGHMKNSHIVVRTLSKKKEL